MTITNYPYTGKNLSDVNFSNLDLSGNIFNCPKFNGSILKNANFNGTNLQHAQFYGVDLTNATFRGSDLRNTHFEDAQLSCADFMGAVVQDARFIRCTGLTEAAENNLKKRGAILDPISSIIDRRWWIEKVLIPTAALLIGTGGIVSITQVSEHKMHKSLPHSIEHTQTIPKNNLH
jgi:hypothetical protein